MPGSAMSPQRRRINFRLAAADFDSDIEAQFQFFLIIKALYAVPAASTDLTPALQQQIAYFAGNCFQPAETIFNIMINCKIYRTAVRNNRL
jgi:hypothetical protein